MIDIKLLRSNIDFFLENYLRRGFNFDIDLFKDLDLKIRAIKRDIDLLRTEHNVKSNSFKLASFNFQNIDLLLKEIEILKLNIAKKKNELVILDEKFNKFLLSLPNLIHKSVPVFNTVSDVFEIRSFKKNIHSFDTEFDFNSKYIDFKSASIVSGHGFVYLKDAVASLHRAICNFMLDYHISNYGYKEVYPPFIVSEKSMYMTGHFPKFIKDQFKIDESNLWLIPTGEVVLANLVFNKVIKEIDLPLRYVAHTPCFRKEAISYGVNAKGMIRQYQFEKVELVQIVDPTKSYQVLEEMVFHAESILKNLDLPYRVIALPDSDIGFSSCKTYDLEAWFPFKKKFIELSSCSNTEAFQARRLKAKCLFNNNVVDYVHILNASGLAVGRTLMAVLENYYDRSGKIFIPNVLRKYMDNKDFFEY